MSDQFRSNLTPWLIWYHVMTCLIVSIYYHMILDWILTIWYHVTLDQAWSISQGDIRSSSMGMIFCEIRSNPINLLSQYQIESFWSESLELIDASSSRPLLTSASSLALAALPWQLTTISSAIRIEPLLEKRTILPVWCKTSTKNVDVTKTKKLLLFAFYV